MARSAETTKAAAEGLIRAAQSCGLPILGLCEVSGGRVLMITSKGTVEDADELITEARDAENVVAERIAAMTRGKR